MRNKIKEIYERSSLTTKIRFYFLILLIPVVLVLFYCFYNLWEGNRQYESMINSTVVASEFSLDFKKDFDYETYLLITGNKTLEESHLQESLEEANRIVAGLEEVTTSRDNLNRLKNVRKYLDNLQTYIDRIGRNLAKTDKYEENMEIWENDVQIVTSLVREEIFQYTYYEVKGIQESYARYQESFLVMIRFAVVAIICMLLVVTLLSYFLPLSITRPFTQLSEVTDQVAKGNLSVRAHVRTGREAKVLSDSLNAMLDKNNELIEQVKTEQIRLRKAEFELLQAQINPHFLYNTLDAIVWLAEAGEQKKVVSMVGSLSEFFRTSLNEGKDIIAVKEELQHVRSYLEIQQVRYQDILKYEIRVPEELHVYMIPKITIQPLVENALYHGIKNKRGLGKIEITGVLKEDCFCIHVRDDGIGIPAERLRQIREGLHNRTSAGRDFYGLYNVNERIRLHFGERFGIFVESTYGAGAEVSILLPRVTEIVEK